jgi:hypothetical protein
VILLALEGEKEILPLQSEDIHKPITTHSSSIVQHPLFYGAFILFMLLNFSYDYIRRSNNKKCKKVVDNCITFIYHRQRVLVRVCRILGKWT